jgi:hypothetical protein
MSGNSFLPLVKIPSLTRRLVIGGVIVVITIMALVLIPYYVLAVVQGYGVSLGLSLGSIVLYGIVLALLSGAAYVLKPTGAYGPTLALGSAVALLYLLAMYEAASIFVLYHGAGVVVTYATLVLLLMAIPSLKLIAAIVTTVEDALHPGERLPFDYKTAR